MWHITNLLEDAAKEDLAFHRPKPQAIPKTPTPKPEEEEKEKEELDPLLEEIEQQRHEHRVELGIHGIGLYHKRIARQKKRKHKPRGKGIRRTFTYSDEARERMDQRSYERALQRQGTLTPRQREILTDYARGLMFQTIAMKNRITIARVGTLLQHARERLDARNNAHAVAIALRKGLIE